MDKVDKSLLGADLEAAREQLRESTSAILASSRHPHEPEIPPALDAEGRCRVCKLLVELDRLRVHTVRVTWHDHEPKPGEGRDDLRVLLNRGDWSVPWVRREVAALFDELRLYKETVTNSADSPITEERPRDAGTSGAAT